MRMAKRTNGGSSRQTSGEPRTRRRTATKADAATAADMAAGGALGPSSDEIARLAYELYLRRGGADGNDVGDWLEAERRLKGRS